MISDSTNEQVVGFQKPWGAHKVSAKYFSWAFLSSFGVCVCDWCHFRSFHLFFFPKVFYVMGVCCYSVEESLGSDTIHTRQPQNRNQATPNRNLPWLGGTTIVIFPYQVCDVFIGLSPKPPSFMFFFYVSELVGSLKSHRSPLNRPFS